MIALTRLNNQSFVLNADLIKYIENAPDTLITLLSGEKIVVRETVEEVLARVAEFHQKFCRRVGPALLIDNSSESTHTGPGETQNSPSAQRLRTR